jgi:hypothetical protein
MDQIVVYKGRTNTLTVALGFDVSNDEFSSEVRADKDRGSELLASWNVSFLTDGVDGELVLTMDDSVSNLVTKNIGYMDLKRLSAGEPLNVFDEPLEVWFKEPITA